MESRAHSRRFVERFGGFEGGTTVPAIVGASVLLWAVHALTLSGVRNAAFANVVVTIAKIVPIVTFVAIAAVGFSADLFTADFWGGNAGLGSTLDQVRNMMLVTVWVFIGIEGAAVYSQRARRRRDVGLATVLGFLGVLGLLLAVNLLSYGVMQQADIANLSDPSLAGVLEHEVGAWGAGFISAALGTRLAPHATVVYLNQSLRFLRPVYPGDTITANLEVTAIDAERRPSDVEALPLVPVGNVQARDARRTPDQQSGSGRAAALRQRCVLTPHGIEWCREGESNPHAPKGTRF